MSEKYGEHNRLSKSQSKTRNNGSQNSGNSQNTVKPHNNGFESTKHSSLLQKSIIANIESKRMSRD